MSVHGRQRCQETRRTSRGKLRTTIMSDQTGRALVPSGNGPADLVDTDPSGRDIRDANAQRQSRIFSTVHSSSSLVERDSFTSTALAEVLDRATHASLAKVTMGLSPASLIAAYLDWLTHLNAAPGKRLQLAEKAFRKWQRLQEIRPPICPGRRSGRPTSRALHRAIAAR